MMLPDALEPAAQLPAGARPLAQPRQSDVENSDRPRRRRGDPDDDEVDYRPRKKSKKRKPASTPVGLIVAGIVGFLVLAIGGVVAVSALTGGSAMPKTQSSTGFSGATSDNPSTNSVPTPSPSPQGEPSTPRPTNRAQAPTPDGWTRWHTPDGTLSIAISAAIQQTDNLKTQYIDRLRGRVTDDNKTNSVFEEIGRAEDSPYNDHHLDARARDLVAKSRMDKPQSVVARATVGGLNGRQVLLSDRKSVSIQQSTGVTFAGGARYYVVGVSGAATLSPDDPGVTGFFNSLTIASP